MQRSGRSRQFGAIGLACLALAIGQWSFTRVLAQASSAPSSYDPRITFAPLTLPDPVNQYRSANGAPGPAYWQNGADYELHAALDTVA